MLVRSPPDLKQPVIKSVLYAGPVVAVVLDPPYREYPNVVFFLRNESSDKWKRQYEVLSLGLTDDGPFIDLHTRDGAVDIAVSNDSSSTVDSAEPLETRMEGVAGHEKMAIVHYLHFEHMHGPIGLPYMIDKRSYTDIGTRQVNERYGSDYSADSVGCMMYDTPVIGNATFTRLARGFQLKAEAVLPNRSVQTWIVTFSGFINGRMAEKTIRVATVAN